MTPAPLPPEPIPEILSAVERHSRRLIGLLDGLDDVRRVASETGIAVLARDGGDLTALLGHLSDELRASDRRLRIVMAELARQS